MRMHKRRLYVLRGFSLTADQLLLNLAVPILNGKTFVLDTGYWHLAHGLWFGLVNNRIK